MVHKITSFLIATLLFVSLTDAQDSTIVPVKALRIAIFAPLYLDSAYDGTMYSSVKGFPKYSQPGFDFVQGALIALDSLPLPKGSIKAFIYDCKAEIENITWLIANHKLDSEDLFIGSVKDVDLTNLAAFAKQKNVPFISATSPNDGGIVNNPFFLMVNATLLGHCENIYSYLLQKHGTDKIYLCKKRGSQEDKVAEYFKAINERDGKPLLKIETLNFENDFSNLRNKLDSNRTSVFIGGSLSEDFVKGISTAINVFKDTFPSVLIGMPNWDVFTDLKKAPLKDLPILITASYFNDKTDMYSKKMSSPYIKKFKGNPSDMAFKGFESVYVFAKILAKYPDDFMSHLNDASNKLFSEFNFKPVFVGKNTSIPDYFENRHLFLVKLFNGKVTRVL